MNNIIINLRIISGKFCFNFTIKIQQFHHLYSPEFSSLTLLSPFLFYSQQKRYALFGSHKEAPEEFWVLKGLIGVDFCIFLGKKNIAKKFV